LKKIPEIPFEYHKPNPLGFEIMSFDYFFAGHSQSIRGIHHKLTFYAILFFTDGEGIHLIDFEEYQYRKGCILFISKEQVHAFPENSSYKGYMILFTSEFLLKSLSASEMMIFKSVFNYQLYKSLVQVKEQDYSEFSNLIKDVDNNFLQDNDTIQENILRNYLKILLLKSERYKNQTADIADSKYYHEFVQFQELLKDEIKKERQVKYYSDKLLMSTKKLNMVTHAVLGSSAKAFISKQLILEIKRDLMNQSASIKEIAYEYGFGEPTNFIKFFKKQTGVSPSDFQNS
jgi:AraC-like DNA-binding protein